MKTTKINKNNISCYHDKNAGDFQVKTVTSITTCSNSGYTIE